MQNKVCIEKEESNGNLQFFYEMKNALIFSQVRDSIFVYILTAIVVTTVLTTKSLIIFLYSKININVKMYVNINI